MGRKTRPVVGHTVYHCYCCCAAIQTDDIKGAGWVWSDPDRRWLCPGCLSDPQRRGPRRTIAASRYVSHGAGIEVFLYGDGSVSIEQDIYSHDGNLMRLSGEGARELAEAILDVLETPDA